MKYRSILVALAALCLSAAGASAQVEVGEAQLPTGLSAGVRQHVLALASKDPRESPSPPRRWPLVPDAGKQCRRFTTTI